MAGFKSDENKQLFIKGLREANFTQEEIDREVKDIEGEAAKPAPAVASPSNSAAPPVADTKKDVQSASPQDSSSPWELNTSEPAQQLKRMAEARSQEGRTLIDNMTPSKDNLLPYALAAGGTALAGYGLYKGAQEIGQGLKSRFFGPKDQVAAKAEPTSSDRLPAAAQQPTSHEQWVANLSPEERTLYERSEEAKAARASASQSMRNESFLEPEKALVSPETQTPEQIRQAKLAAATQAAQQNMAAPPPETAPKKMWEPPKAELAISQPAPVAAAPVEPVAPVEAAPAPAETPKNTNEKILETINKVAPKAETAPVELPKEEPEKPLKWPGKAKGGAGAEGFALQQLGASRATYSKQHAAALEILKDRTNGILTQSPSGGGIHQQEELSKMYEDYTGKPIPKTEKGGWARIPDSQVAELHAGILNELQEAAKSGKLKSLGKGALAAAALLGISEAVQAAQKGNFGPLKEAGFDLGIGALGGPAVMAAQAALTGTTLESGMTKKGQREFQNRQEILNREGVKDYLQMLKQLNPNPADYTKAAEQYLATNPNAPKSKLQRFNEQTQQQRSAQAQKEHSLRK